MPYHPRITRTARRRHRSPGALALKRADRRERLIEDAIRYIEEHRKLFDGHAFRFRAAPRLLSTLGALMEQNASPNRASRSTWWPRRAEGFGSKYAGRL